MKYKNEKNGKLNQLNNKINDILLNLEFELGHEKLKKRFFKRVNAYEALSL